ncbi:hypothetical protein UK23_31985 [Lentzea aerocolonigenes]|uniref:Uncharacterized protein n=1 Tax=Lentzea aerocolonigenes TaxID=68170 RepID=A0A0F0GQT9_LENAE|nr:hypothetical protein [Lentzea aerocolonigenes]KJK43778.1 hypothetical protein UK23_31985 [Lentzea aerocolonigenes]
MRAKRTIAVITALLGLSLATAAPASAAAGSWVSYGNRNPITTSTATWRCAGSEQIAPSVLAQVCAVRSANGLYYQGAVIVRNNRSALFSTTAQMSVINQTDVVEGTWVCPSSGVGANSWSVCFGRSQQQGTFALAERASGYGHGWWLGVSPSV